MTGEQNPFKSAVIDMKSHAIALDVELAKYAQGKSELSQDELFGVVRNGIEGIITRANGASLVVALRSAPKEEDTHEDL